MKMHLICQLSICLVVASGCIPGAGSVDKRRANLKWYQEKDYHLGSQLTGEDLESLSRGDEKHFWKILEPILVPRVPDTLGHAQVRQHIVSQMNSMEWTVELDTFEMKTPIGRKNFTNIIATLNPSSTRRLVLACHYDSKLDPAGFIGATDSAVPCAMLINLAKVLNTKLKQQKKDTTSDLTLQFLFIDGEEAFKRWSNSDSLYGARHMASQLQSLSFPPGNSENTNELHRMDMFVLLDLLGTSDCEVYSYFRNTDHWYKRLANYERTLVSMNLDRRPYFFTDSQRFGAGIADDHVPFLKRDVPILHIICLPFPSVWHKSSDKKNALHRPTIKKLNTLTRTLVADYLQLMP